MMVFILKMLLMIIAIGSVIVVAILAHPSVGILALLILLAPFLFYGNRY